MHLRERLLERRHHFRQGVACLGVGRHHRQPALIAIAELFGQTLDVPGIEQHAFDDSHQFLARVGQAEQALALAHEQLDAEFGFQVLDVLADARLGGEQGIGRLGQVEIVPDGFADDAKLLDIHGGLAAVGAQPPVPESMRFGRIY